jgi:hypothetical protein
MEGQTELIKKTVTPVSHQQFYLIILKMKRDGLTPFQAAEKVIGDFDTLKSFKAGYHKWETLMRACR